MHRLARAQRILRDLATGAERPLTQTARRRRRLEQPPCRLNTRRVVWVACFCGSAQGSMKCLLTLQSMLGAASLASKTLDAGDAASTVFVPLRRKRR